MSQKQHYIPVSLLNGFLDPISLKLDKIEPYLWYYKKGNGVKKKSPVNILWERNFYTQYDIESQENNELETFFSKFLENPLKQFKKKYETDLLKIDIKKLVSNGIESERLFLSAFTFWHWKRTKSFISELKNSFEKELLKENSRSKVSEFMNSKFLQNELITMLIGIGNKFDNKSFIDYIIKKDIYFTIIENDKTNFINSDNPLIRANEFGPNGIIYHTTELSMPLTSKILITFIGNNSKMYFRRVKDRTSIRKINQNIARNASEIIYGTNKEQLEKLIKYLPSDSV
ncbi:DUF4238 domain-containing protein [Leptospira sp. 201903074]|uniref:DUF4238 domain-containing protein n=1 Tax=Leptospira abararensis TaxID=2810036 RepID=UPI001965088C|nr:DUF4238 domain-containing protein [Leptospira abararensis]MBM9546644.1 DUF4238 domain-containing protein [Leptospira abararensis]